MSYESELVSYVGILATGGTGSGTTQHRTLTVNFNTAAGDLMIIAEMQTARQSASASSTSFVGTLPRAYTTEPTRAGWNFLYERTTPYHHIKLYYQVLSGNINGTTFTWHWNNGSTARQISGGLSQAVVIRGVGAPSGGVAMPGGTANQPDLLSEHIEPYSNFLTDGDRSQFGLAVIFRDFNNGDGHWGNFTPAFTGMFTGESRIQNVSGSSHHVGFLDRFKGMSDDVFCKNRIYSSPLSGSTVADTIDFGGIIFDLPPDIPLPDTDDTHIHPKSLVAHPGSPEPSVGGSFNTVSEICRTSSGIVVVPGLHTLYNPTTPGNNYAAAVTTYDMDDDGTLHFRANGWSSGALNPSNNPEHDVTEFPGTDIVLLYQYRYPVISTTQQRRLWCCVDVSASRGAACTVGPDLVLNENVNYGARHFGVGTTKVIGIEPNNPTQVRVFGRSGLTVSELSSYVSLSTIAVSGGYSGDTLGAILYILADPANNNQFWVLFGITSGSRKWAAIKFEVDESTGAISYLETSAYTYPGSDWTTTYTSPGGVSEYPSTSGTWNAWLDADGNIHAVPYTSRPQQVYFNMSEGTACWNPVNDHWVSGETRSLVAAGSYGKGHNFCYTLSYTNNPDAAAPYNTTSARHPIIYLCSPGGDLLGMIRIPTKAGFDESNNRSSAIGRSPGQAAVFNFEYPISVDAKKFPFPEGIVCASPWEVPWLRQSQRDDPVRTNSGRSGNRPRSIQASIRQDWNNTYL